MCLCFTVQKLKVMNEWTDGGGGGGGRGASQDLSSRAFDYNDKYKEQYNMKMLLSYLDREVVRPKGQVISATKRR